MDASLHNNTDALNGLGNLFKFNFKIFFYKKKNYFKKIFI